MPRTIVVSDLHGRLAPLEAALAHASFKPGEDGLVVAGDLIDVGPDDTLSRAEQLGATILAGNHEVAAALGLHITPQHKASLERGPEFAERMIEGDWPLAVAVDDWLITHAGLSSTFSDVMQLAGGDVRVFAAELNERFVNEMRAAISDVPLTWDDLERYRIIGGSVGPLWFRPYGPESLLWGLRQVVGHTAPEMYDLEQKQQFERAEYLLVDPGGHGGGRIVAPLYRYAIIEDGKARVVDA